MLSAESIPPLGEKRNLWRKITNLGHVPSCFNVPFRCLLSEQLELEVRSVEIDARTETPHVQIII